MTTINAIQETLHIIEVSIDMIEKDNERNYKQLKDLTKAMKEIHMTLQKMAFNREG